MGRKQLNPVSPVVVGLTHEQRQELIRRPITFNYYGCKASAGTSIRNVDYVDHSIGSGFDSGSKDYEFD